MMTQQNMEIIYKEISKLSNSQKKILLTKLITEIPIVDNDPSGLNIIDLKGIGKEIWDNIDAQEYVNSERASWE